VDKIITNVKAGEVLVKSFLKNRLEGDDDELEKVKNLNAVKKKSDSVAQGSGESLGVAGLSGDDEKGSDMGSESSEEESEEYSEEDIEKSEEDSSETKEVETLAQSKTSKHSVNISQKTKSESKKSKIPTTNEKQPKESSEIIIKKINMDDFDVESEIPTDTVPSFLLVNNKLSSSDAKSQKPKKKDAFFVTSDDSGDEEEDNDKEADNNDRLKGGGADDVDEETELERGKHAFRSTFMGSLSEKDWRRGGRDRNSEKTRRTTAPRSSTSNHRNKTGKEFPKKNSKQNLR
jgi:hypothetical protein